MCPAEWEVDVRWASAHCSLLVDSHGIGLAGMWHLVAGDVGCSAAQTEEGRLRCVVPGPLPADLQTLRCWCQLARGLPCWSGGHPNSQPNLQNLLPGTSL